MPKRLVVLLMLLCVSACGHTGTEHARFVDAVRGGDMETAYRLTRDDDFYTDSASLNARWFELGSYHYLNGEYCQALRYFDQARERAKELYTKSLSRSFAAQFAGDGLIPYAGEKYEQSMLRFYQSLTHYLLSKRGYCEAYETEEDGEKKLVEKRDFDAAEKRLHFNAARASILDWNSLLTTFTRESDDKDEFHQDMLAKTWGAEMHDIYGSNGDRQIARQLYRDVPKLLESDYAGAPSLQSENGEKLKAYAKAKGADLYAGDAKKENVRFVVKVGLIAPKKAEKVDFTIPLSAFLASGSGNDFVSCLGMILPGQRISFEIASVPEPAKVADYRLTVANAAGKRVADAPLVLTAPVSETAYKEFKRKRAKLISTRGARLTGKYVSAAVAACSFYNKDNALSMLMAYGAFAGSLRLIESSEYADTRYWGLLPNAVLQLSLRLKKGDYTGEVVSGGKTVKTFSFTVDDSRAVLVDLNIPDA